jgi:hypothetical protein
MYFETLNEANDTSPHPKSFPHKVGKDFKAIAVLPFPP